MRYTHFRIKNFKGIADVQLNLVTSPVMRVHTLIGLNESGKSSILEAIDRWTARESLDALKPPGYTQRDLHEVVPIASRSNFNGEISIEAGIELDEDDQKSLRNNALKLGITIARDVKPFTIRQAYKFQASVLDKDARSNVWTVAFVGREVGRRKDHQLTGDAWKACMSVLRPMLPRIVYFPNFLFEWPDRIYLENAPSEEQKHAFYQAVLQDVLDAVGDGTNLRDHVLARAKSTDEFQRKAMQSVLLRMGADISETVFRNWDKIFKRPAGKKEIVVDIQADARGAWYLQLRLKDGSELYEISERSLGFRWFFTYLLLTQYRGFRSGGQKNVVFLLDDPASNLHPSAQAQLLDSFTALPEGCSVIYTTHSHHLIKPEWLEGAFVVRNEGLHYDESDDGYTSKGTRVTLTRYRTFATNHPDQTTYFQPVLDVLDYRATELDCVPDVVMVEGKSDYYLLSYMQRVLKRSPPIRFLPGTGAGSLDTVIRLYAAWGRDFIVVLDGDGEGRRQSERYSEVFGGLVANRVFKLGDLEPSLVGQELENLLDPADAYAIQLSSYPDAQRVTKKFLTRAVQERIANPRIPFSPSQATTERFIALYDAIEGALERSALEEDVGSE